MQHGMLYDKHMHPKQRNNYDPANSLFSLSKDCDVSLLGSSDQDKNRTNSTV